MFVQYTIGSICEDLDMVRSQALKLTQMSLEKTLEAHPDKSGLIVLGSEKYKETIRKDLEEIPIYLTNFKLEFKESEKYLGQLIHSNLSRSALETVKSRAGKVKGTAMEV